MGYPLRFVDPGRGRRRKGDPIVRMASAVSLFRSWLLLLVVSVLVASCTSGRVQGPETPTAVSPQTSSAPSITVSPTSPIKEFGTMWTFDAPPLAYWKARYGFDATPQWLDHVRLAAVRLPNCSASVVSSNGLVMTNHHCARECTTASSPRDSNYIETGFVASALTDEKRCPGMTADQLQSIEDVTNQVQSAITASTPADQAQQRAAAVARIQGDCGRTTGLICQVVTLYQGGRYSLYRFKRFSDLRLVMAPEGDIAFFGGDPDNFTFPRYDLDLTLLRIYENGAPLKADHYLKWSAAGAVDGDLTFVIGNPGATGRLNTIAQMGYLRDVSYPNILDQLKRQTAGLKTLEAKGGEAAKRKYEDEIFSLENSIKAYTGYRSGLLDSAIMAKKTAFERDFRVRIESNPDTRVKFGGAWDAIANANRERRAIATQLRFYSQGASQLLNFALALVRLPVEAAKPDSLRLPAYRGRGIMALRAALADTEAIDRDEEEVILAAQWQAALEALGPNDPVVRAALAGRSPAEAAHAAVAGTALATAPGRKTLLDGGATAVLASSDPLIVIARVIDPLNRPIAVQSAALQSVIAANGERLGQAIYAAYGTMLPPDATFTLRISDGVVRGYPMNGTIAPYKTSMYGLYAHSAEFDDKAPFNLPKRWKERRDRLDLTTPLDFVTTNDIIGGNSGSPVVNRAGEVVGLIFDSNIEGLPNNFIFTDDVARSVSVHSRAITTALRSIYDAKRLADELEGIPR
jgi:peptidase S46-like protein